MKTDSKNLDCLCAGIVVADFVCAPIARVPAAGALEMTESILPSIGGCAANVATDLAKIGRRSAIVGRIGADFSGRFVKDELAACGVETDSLVETPGWQTSSTLVINVKHEDRRFIHTFGASSAFDGSEVSDDLLRRTRRSSHAQAGREVH